MSSLHSFVITLVIFLALVQKCPSKTVKHKTEGPKRECPPPNVREPPNGTEVSISKVSGIDHHQGATEVKFNGAVGGSEPKRQCKLKCVNGEWIGPLCLSDGANDEKYLPVYKACSSDMFLDKFVLSYQNKTIMTAREFPHSTVVQVRCKEFGIYKLIGDAHLSCHNGVWKNRIPACIPTSSLRNYTDDSAPPTVLAKVTSGSASIEPTGELAVYPGSTVHLECLYLRAAGAPEWSWTSTYRIYPTGWAINTNEREFSFRLSIFYIKPQDTGIYTCATPKGLTNSIILNVVAVHCDTSKVVTTDPNLLTQVDGSRLGQKVTFQCREGFKLNGTANMTCQASGIWSSYPPRCIPIVCEKLPPPEGALKLLKQDITYGGVTAFECPFGYKTIGNLQLICEGEGSWSSPMPSCKEINCPPPLIPSNGKLEYSNASAIFPYRVGSVLTFSCKGVYQLVGEDSILCQESGFWSNPPPFCKTKCPHPGNPPNGRYTPDKVNFEVGERTALICSNGYEPSSKSRPRCQKSGDWSEPALECRFRPGRQTTRKTGQTTEPDDMVETSVTIPGPRSDEQPKFNSSDVFYLVEE